MLVVYLGLLAMVVASYLGLVRATDSTLPEARGVAPGAEDLVQQGRQVYIGLGCVYCHTQQVRPDGFGADQQRGWGERRTTATDYAFDAPPLLGTMRTGPDLAAIGARQPSADWHYLHLYNPTLVSPGSTMPRFPFLFERVTPFQGPPLGAVQTPPGLLPAGTYLRPTSEGAALVAYLLALDKTRDPEPEDAP
jgi:cytochrome c oxidase cbb3-type subunit 2